MASHRPLRFICITKLPTGVVCNRGFHNRSGLTQHIRSNHRKFAPAPLPDPDLPLPINDFNADAPDVGDFDEEGPRHGAKIVKHPILDGMSSLIVT